MLLEVKNVSYRYSKNSKWILKDVSFTVDSKERVALVGPSGYGKSTLSKIISGYIKPDKGEVLWDGKPIPEKCYCPIQMIYQHPEQSVNPRWKMGKTLNEGWNVDNNLLATSFPLTVKGESNFIVGSNFPLTAFQSTKTLKGLFPSNLLSKVL